MRLLAVLEYMLARFYHFSPFKAYHDLVGQMSCF